MATDFAVYYLTRPFGLLMQLGLLIGPLIATRLAFPKAFAALGFRRLIFAHMAVAVVVFLLAGLSAFSVGSTKLELGHIQRDELYSWIAGNSVYLFVLGYIFALVFASFVLSPVCLWLARTGKATLVIFAALGAMMALAMALLSIAFPGNEWGRTHRLELFASTLSSVGLGAFLVCVAFACGAGLPMRKTKVPNAA